MTVVNTTPLISVVLCTYNRAELLYRALGALCGQTLDANLFEVIVIDDGSTDRTRSIVDIFRDLLPLHYAYQENSGLASGKNHGIFLSRSPIILFLDDDDVADSKLLEQHLVRHRQYPQLEYAVLGYTDLTESVARSPLMHYVTEIECRLFSYPHLQDGAVLDYTYFWGGRSSCKRMFLLEHGVFNPVFRFGAEDIELGFRLSKTGLKVVFDRQAISHMIRVLDFESFCRRSYLQGQSNWVFSQLHNEPAVQKWSQVHNADVKWEKLEPIFERLIKSARDIDRFAQCRVNNSLVIDELTKALLHRAYGEAFTASFIKGVVSKKNSQIEGQPTQLE